MSRAPALLGCLALWLAFPATARAEPQTLRIASLAPAGTPWAREFAVLADEIATITQSRVRLKLYLSAVAGDDFAAEERVRRGQLDGIIGGTVCQKLAPTTRVLRLMGTYESLDEAAIVLERLEPAIADEARLLGYHLIGTMLLGPDVFLTRTPVHGLADLKRLRLWRWEGDQVVLAQSKELGLQTVPLPVEEAARAYDQGRIDGFVAVPSAALAFQMFTRARHLLDVRLGYLPACMVIASRAWEKLPPADKELVTAASLRMRARLIGVSRKVDEQLLDGLFQGQLRRSPAQPALGEELFAQARRSIAKLSPEVAPPELVEKVHGILRELRARAHP